MIKNSIIGQYLSHGKNLILLNGKIPRDKAWRTKIFSKEELEGHNGNLGWCLGSRDLIIDVDPRNGGDESYKRLAKRLKLDLEPLVNTPRGGFHIYLTIPEEYVGRKFIKNHKTYEGVDFLTEGAYVVICGSETEKGKYAWSDDIFGEFIQIEAEKELLDLISTERKDKTAANDLGDFAGMFGSSFSNWDEEKVLARLNKISPNISNSEWVKVGMALHDWGPEDGLALWDEWSKPGETYKEGECEKRWRSFDLDGGVTLGTVSHMADDADYDAEADRVKGYIKTISKATEKEIYRNLIPKIKKDTLEGMNQKKLIVAIQDRLKAITGVKQSISDIKKKVVPVQVVSGEFIADEEKPEWCENWAYITSHSSYIELSSLDLCKTEAFNIKNSKYVPEIIGGSAANYVATKGFMEDVSSIAYLPNTNNAIVKINGKKVVNSFNPKSVPKEAKTYSDEGLEAIELIKKHIKFICSTDENASILTQWLAHNIQFPGKQLLWSPVIQGVQGVGKSFFGQLLRGCLGNENVGTVSPSQVVNSFNGWATNVSVNVLEELRVVGNNRYDAINSLKPLITDTSIQINDKGVKQYNTANTTNYICFTNFKDALPLDNNDRRWWVIFVPADDLQDVKEYVGEDIKTYFPRLFDAARTHNKEVRKWLLEYKLTPEFLNTKQAPMTEYKLSMIATEENSLEGYAETKELIEKGGKYFNKKVICSNELFDSLVFEYPDIDIIGRTRNLILKKLGYTLHPKVIKIDGKTRRVWSKKSYENSEIRELLENN